MKAGIKAIGLLIFLSICQGCSTMKTRNRVETSVSTEEKTSSSESATHQQTVVMQRAVLDSREAEYKIVIYPTDSFQFSLKDGFKGTATKVEVTGSIKQKKLLKDSTSVTSLDATESAVETLKKTNAKLATDDKTVERTPVSWRVVVLLGLVVIGLVVWVRWKKTD